MELTREQLRKQKMVIAEGMLVEQDALRIAQRIKEYDPNLTLQFLESADSVSEPPFRVIEHCKDGLDRVAFTAWTLDERLLQRIYAGDNTKHDIDALMTKQNAAAKKAEEAKAKEAIDEAGDMVKSIIKSPRTRYTARPNDKKVTFE